jgi:site-specific DNA-methyltransferase (adenine-specific)
MKIAYQNENVTLWHGDSREWSGKADAVVSDPPYPGREDLFPTDAVWPVLRRMIPATKALLFWPCIADFPCGVPDAVHVWHKSVPIHPRSEVGNVAGHQYERILSYGCGAKCEVFRVAAIMPNFASCAEELTPHPTQKPVALVGRLLDRVKGDTVLDPFCGSGTTLIAALETGRKAIGIEIDERWVDVARRRLERWHAQGRFDFSPANNKPTVEA